MILRKQNIKIILSCNVIRMDLYGLSIIYNIGHLTSFMKIVNKQVIECHQEENIGILSLDDKIDLR